MDVIQQCLPRKNSLKRAERILRSLCFLACVGLLGMNVASGMSGKEGWQFGKAKVNITPMEPMWMSGYGGRDRVAEGKLTDLWAKVLVLKPKTGDMAILITMDLVGIDQTLSDSIRKRLADEYGIEVERIVLCCSHTHTGPVVGMNLAPLHYLQVERVHQAQIDEYAVWLKSQVIKSVSVAMKNLSSGSVSWGTGRCAVAVNRRNNREASVPSVRSRGELAGPTDHDTPVLVIKDLDHRIQVIVFGYACHATVLSFYQWSGDYPGYAQMALESRLPGVQAMFWAGCGGDQNPLPRRKVELARHYGERLALAVESVIATQELRPLAASLESRSACIPLPYASVPELSELRETLDSKDRFEKARAQWLLSIVETNGGLSETYPYPIVTWNLGDQIQWVFLGGEVVVDYALRIKKENRGTSTWVAGYTNDVMAYIPSRRVLREGGYEGAGAMVYYGLPGPWNETVEQRIMDEVTSQLSEGDDESTDRQK